MRFIPYSCSSRSEWSGLFFAVKYHHRTFLLVWRQIDCRIQRMFVSRVRLLTSLVLLAGVLFWFGCPTPPKPGARITVLETAHVPASEPGVQTVMIPLEPAL